MSRNLTLIIIAIIAVVMLTDPNVKSTKPQFGVFFSQGYASELGLDWKEVYQKILTDLNIKHLRLPTYWNRTEAIQGKLDFTEIDYMLDEAKKHNVSVSLVLGAKQPRWPECHTPDWVKQLTIKERQQATLEYIDKVVKRYKGHHSIWSYQVENEPLFSFGDGCDPIDIEFLKREVELVRSLDPDKPIILTDTGEWSTWRQAMSISDILGISIYRYAYSSTIGYFNYPFPKEFYTLKSWLVRKLFAQSNQETLVTELQAEPWFTTVPTETDVATHKKLFKLNQLTDNINFAQSTGFSRIYLWGVEWWYYMLKQGHSEYWDQAKKLISSD